MPLEVPKLPNAGGWIFLDLSDSISKLSGDETSKLTHIAEGIYKVLDISERTVAIRHGTLVERITVDLITSAHLLDDILET